MAFDDNHALLEGALEFLAGALVDQLDVVAVDRLAG